ncbi:helix-turn-helix domain-containing protein [Brochothrix campestris]|uniref:helix-turn-helix domain-containing protein n=1 Tax=Brochothrix campestris TaxID=2757 RepID=UPI0022B4AB6D|nr:HTH domain-containing protein [Brochothrix campestris]
MCSMFLTTREKVILETLVKNKAGNTLDYFSSLLKVSRRTVQRDFKTVSHTLALFHLSLSKRDQEFYIAGTNANLFKLAQELHQSEAFDQTPEEKKLAALKNVSASNSTV